MYVTVRQRSSITRFEGSFSSLSALLLAAHPCEADREESEAMGEGALAEEGEGRLSFSYREEESGIPVTVLLDHDTLTVRRALTELTFTNKAKSRFTYCIDYGKLETEAYTERLTLVKKGSSFLLTLVYFAVFSGIAQRNEMRFKLDPK